MSATENIPDRELVTLFSLFLLLRSQLPAAAANQQPKALFLAVDDLNDRVGCLGGHMQAEAPNIDKLAREEPRP